MTTLEIEAKLKVASHEPVRDALRREGGTLEGVIEQTDRYCDRPDGSLRRSGYALRIRSESGSDRPEPSAVITVKGPVRPGAYKSREEIELPLPNLDQGRRLVELLGFVEVFELNKRRERWLLGECRVELDFLTQLGAFVEIEGPSEAAITDVQRKLGLDGLTHIANSYLGLVQAAAQAGKLPPA